MVKVGVRDEDVVNFGHFLDRKITYACTSIDQYVIVNVQRGGAQITANTTAATEYFYLHT